MSTVIVAGPAVSLNGVFGYHNLDASDLNADEVFLSKKEYGNHLDKLWAYFKLLNSTNNVVDESLFAQHAKEHNFTVISYASDGELLRNGVNVIEAEGNMYRGKCMRCQTEMAILPEDYEHLTLGEVFTCPKCGKDRVRPDVRLVGEKEMNRRDISDVIRSAPRTIFVDVDMYDMFINKLERESALSYVVNPEPVPGVKTILMTPEEWVEAGCPVNEIKY